MKGSWFLIGSWLIGGFIFLFYLLIPKLTPINLNNSQFPMSVDEIAASDDTLFVLEYRTNKIFAYSYEGTMLYLIMFSSSGTNYIYVEDNELYRYDARKDTVFHYINGEQKDETIVEDEFVPPGHEENPYEFVETVETSSAIIQFDNHRYVPSFIIIHGEEESRFVVEPFWMHLIQLTIETLLVDSIVVFGV